MVAWLLWQLRLWRLRLVEQQAVITGKPVLVGPVLLAPERAHFTNHAETELLRATQRTLPAKPVRVTGLLASVAFRFHHCPEQKLLTSPYRALFIALMLVVTVLMS